MERAFIICGKLVTKIEAQFLTSAEFLLQFNYNFWRQQNFKHKLQNYNFWPQQNFYYNLITISDVSRILITI
jgi:hypothetical protein